MKNGEKKKRESMFFFQVLSPFYFMFLEIDTEKKKKKLHSSFSLNSSRSGSAGSSPPWRCS